MSMKSDLKHILNLSALFNELTVSRYSKSLLVSLLIHLLLLVVVFFSYKEVSQYLHERKQECSCCSTTINLSAVETKRVEAVKKIEQKKQVKREPFPKKVEKKLHKKVKKTPPKKIEKKIKVPLKTIESVEEIVQTPTEVILDKNTTKKVTQTKAESPKEQHCETDVITTKAPQQKADEYIASHISEIVTLLQDNLYYPRRARRKKIEGVVRVRFTLTKNAEVTNIQVLESKYDILSNAAIKTIKELQGKMPQPREKLILTIPINYELK